MKKIMRRIFCVLTAASLCGCSAQSRSGIMLEHDPVRDKNSDKTVLTFFGYKAEAASLIAVENALCDFMNKNKDVYVSFEGIDSPSYWAAFEARDRTGNLDDIFMLDREHILSLSRAGKLADLSGISSPENYIPWIKARFSENGSVWFLPACISTYELYINTDVLNENGQKIPENLGEFKSVCEYFVNKGITPIVAASDESLPAFIMSASLCDDYSEENYAKNIEKYNNREADLSKKLRSGLDLAEFMRLRGYINGYEFLNTLSSKRAADIFSKGERPFMIAESKVLPFLEVDFSFEATAFPVLSDGLVTAAALDSCIGINAKSQNIDRALKLAEYMTQAEVLDEYCKSQNALSPLVNGSPAGAEKLPRENAVLLGDLNLKYCPEEALLECLKEIMRGKSAAEAEMLLYDLLYADKTKGDAP